MPQNTTPFDAFAAAHLPGVEAALDRYSGLEGDAGLKEAMRYSLLMPGKRVRPLLTLDACGGKPEDAMPAACAAEMVHAFSLIHDDLPAMDDDDVRRGKPTNHNVHGEAAAILAGDALLALAFETILREMPAEKARSCALELAKASGTAGMAGGQAMDMRGLNAGATIDDVRLLHSRKTGALIVACARMGALVAGAKQEHLEALTAYARGIGVAFQITDDLLDVTGGKELGKTPGKDAAQGKITYPSLLGLDGSRKAAQDAVDAAISAIAPFGKKAEPLADLAGFILARKT
jgi:geranylgeranyl diphosphate synthase, type II